MIEDVVENLDRAWAALNAQPSVDLIVNSYRFFDQLKRDTRIAAIMEDLRREEAESVEILTRAHSDVAVALGQIANDLEQSAPDAFPAPPKDRNEHDASLRGVRNYLTRAARTIAEPFMVGRLRSDGNELSYAIGLLRAGATRAERADTLERLTELQRQFDYANRSRQIFYLTSAASSLVVLEQRLLDLHPPPVDQGEEAEIARHARAVRTPLGAIGEAIFGLGKLNLEDAEVKALIEGMRDDIKRIYEDIRRRLGQERSLLAVFQRYRQRCQWYDAERLRDIAAKSNSKPEDRLVDTLVSYLFDHGLNPLTQPLAGKIRPDLLDAHSRFSFYVEAKQYIDASPGYLLEGMQQVWDMLGQLHGSGYDVREAFYVIYRRGGPRYDFAHRVQHRDRVVHVLMIDIAPTDERGSNAPPTRTFTADDLRPKSAVEMKAILDAVATQEVASPKTRSVRRSAKKSRKPAPKRAPRTTKKPGKDRLAPDVRGQKKRHDR